MLKLSEDALCGEYSERDVDYATESFGLRLRYQCREVSGLGGSRREWLSSRQQAWLKR